MIQQIFIAFDPSQWAFPWPLASGRWGSSRQNGCRHADAAGAWNHEIDRYGWIFSGEISMRTVRIMCWLLLVGHFTQPLRRTIFKRYKNRRRSNKKWRRDTTGPTDRSCCQRSGAEKGYGPIHPGTRGRTASYETGLPKHTSISCNSNSQRKKYKEVRAPTDLRPWNDYTALD